MIVTNMEGRTGGKVANQFIISEEGRGANGNFIRRDVFQSYNSIIATRTVWDDRTDIELDPIYWDYSRTTKKYLSKFLDLTAKEISEKIHTGEYRLVNLN